MKLLSSLVLLLLFGATQVAAEPADGPIKLENVVPVVIRTVPEAGTDGVDPNLKSISVTFSKKMQDGSWSWVQMSKDTFPTMRGKPRYLEGNRTNVIDVTLEPNQTYAIWFNSDKFRNFKDEQGRAALPYLLVFRTGDAKEGKPWLDAEVGREGSKVRFLTEDDKTIIDITSEFGIDKATIIRKSDEWPKAILVRLHLSGLESFKAGSGNVAVEWSVSSTGGHATRTSLVSGKRVAEIKKDSPYFADVRIVGGNGKIPLKEGFFEVPLPTKLFEGNPEEITLKWIDFYRN